MDRVGASEHRADADTELGPYAVLVPRWLSLRVVGIVLLAVGATYERRLAQAREAVAWVSGLS